MQALVREGMQLGAVGLSTGLMYDPGMYSETAEVIALAAVVEPFHGTYDSHVRNPVHDLLGSDREVIRIGEAARIPAKIGHLKAVGLQNEGLIHEVIRMVEEARARGLNVVSDQYPYDGAATARLIEVLVPPPELLTNELITRLGATDASESDREGVLDEMAALWVEALGDPSTRAQIKEHTERPPADVYSWVETVGYDSFRLVASDAHADWEGRMIVDLATELGETPFDVIAQLIEDDGAVAKITLGACLEDDVRTILTRPWTMVASDFWPLKIASY